MSPEAESAGLISTLPVFWATLKIFCYAALPHIALKRYMKNYLVEVETMSKIKIEVEQFRCSASVEEKA